MQLALLADAGDVRIEGTVVTVEVEARRPLHIRAGSVMVEVVAAEGTEAAAEPAIAKPKIRSVPAKAARRHP